MAITLRLQTSEADLGPAGDTTVLCGGELVPTDLLAEAQSDRGHVALLRRDDGALELRVNGVFVMHDQETTTERLLARATLAEVTAQTRDYMSTPRLRVLVGGLGLGFTLAEVLRHSSVSSVVAVEIEPVLVQWHRDGLVPGSRVTDTRVVVEVGDVRDVVATAPPGDFDVVMLDVDNGPDFLVYDGNAALYEAPFLGLCRRALGAGGVLAIWSADVSEPLRAALIDVFGSCRQRSVPVRLGGRETEYHLFFAHRPVP